VRTTSTSAAGRRLHARGNVHCDPADVAASPLDLDYVDALGQLNLESSSGVAQRGRAQQIGRAGPSTPPAHDRPVLLINRPRNRSSSGATIAA
jgi:hypothetical protein